MYKCLCRACGGVGVGLAVTFRGVGRLRCLVGRAISPAEPMIF